MKPPASTHWQWPTVDAGVRDDRWARFLGDLKTFASLPQPLQTEGTLVRVTGLVLEATGLRLPVGSVCDVIGTDAQPVQAEVVGFHGDRCFLMPTGEAAFIWRHLIHMRRSSTSLTAWMRLQTGILPMCSRYASATWMA